MTRGVVVACDRCGCEVLAAGLVVRAPPFPHATEWFQARGDLRRRAVWCEACAEAVETVPAAYVSLAAALGFALGVPAGLGARPSNLRARVRVVAEQWSARMVWRSLTREDYITPDQRASLRVAVRWDLAEAFDVDVLDVEFVPPRAERAPFDGPSPLVLLVTEGWS